MAETAALPQAPRDKASTPETAPARELLGARIDMLFALGRDYALLPCAAFVILAVLFRNFTPLWLSAVPLLVYSAGLLLMARLRHAYATRDPGDDPLVWARRHTVLCGVLGLAWGIGSVIWFVPGSYPSEALLCLVYVAAATASMIRCAVHRPAFLAVVVTAVGPLVFMLFREGEFHAVATGTFAVIYIAALVNYTRTLAAAQMDAISLRVQNDDLVSRLQKEKIVAELARDAAETSARAKTVFISTISHEIRTPLNAILGMAQLLERGDLEKTQRDYVKVLLEAGRGLKTLLDDVIALSQREDEMLRAPDEGCDAAQAARTVVRLLQPNAWEKRLRLTLTIAGGLPRVAADPRQLRRVLLKLAGNAIKFTDKGGVEIALASAEEDGRTVVRFRVVDTGPGILPEIATTLFDPFAKPDGSYARRHNGAGVGLAVAKRLVESMGGTIDVQSEPGAGATFWFTVPASQTAAREDVCALEDAPPPNGLSLLVYAEDAETRANLEQLLAPFNNRITAAGTLAEAAAAAARESFALILAASDGIAALAAIPGQRAPILALTVDETTRPEGAAAALHWPAAPPALYSAIAALTAGIASGAETDDAAAPEAAIDAKVFAGLEKSLGLKTLVDILRAYLGTAETLAAALTKASEAQDWNETGRLAQDFAGASGSLGLVALTSAARALAQTSRQGDGPHSGAAAEVLAEHRRAREALTRLYPDLAA